MKNVKEPARFCLGDRGRYWYLIPVEKLDAWFRFTALDEDDPRSRKVPKWAKMICGPHCLSFTDPREDW
jgi:hypothetical protein